MKKLLIAITLTLSYSTFASVYSGIDNNGNACSIEISDTNNGMTLVKVVTTDIVSGIYTQSIEGSVTLENQTFQGNPDITVKTKDTIILEIENDIPTRAEITRARSIKGNGWFSSYRATEEYGGTQESVCHI